MQGRADGPARFAPTGEVVGPFEVLGAIGQGAMGRVTRARQINLNRLVALKLLDDRLAHDTGQVQRFLREAKAAAALRHPNVAALIDVGSCPASGKHFIAFELVDGPSVEDLLRERGRLPEAEALSVCLGMAEAITCLEQHNLVHRDLQPSNILIGDDGTPKLIDLGLAKRLDETGSITVGAFLTTPHYVAPEQAMAMEQLDSRADLYALGITLFRCVTGALP
ncbi:MAG: serine/threonine protein kinase, partial [Planctomycetota bacterium]|nr:serine/threonine protein kinase [Planctomycetota bacterium]